MSHACLGVTYVAVGFEEIETLGWSVLNESLNFFQARLRPFFSFF